MIKETVIYISPVKSTFVQADLQILKEKYSIHFIQNSWNNRFKVPILLLKQLIILPLKILKCKAVYISFGGYWSLLPCIYSRLLGKPAYIIIHGTDAASIPSLNYGNLRKPLLKLFCKWSYIYSTKLLPVSKSLIYTKNEFCSNIPANERQQGIKHFFPNLKPNYQIIPNGFNIEFWNADKSTTRNKKRISAVFSNDQFILKGGNLIISIAKLIPDYEFTIAGSEKPKETEVPENVTFIGKVAPEKLRTLYSESNFYFQLSCYEGFGCSLCEAMLCGCVPVGSNVNVIPEIIGGTGPVMDQADAKLIASELLKYNKKGKIDREKIRKQITDNYDKSRRRDLLLSLIEK